MIRDEMRRKQEDRIARKRKFLIDLEKGWDFPFYYGEKGLYHYTSIETMFSILESDSFWVSGTRFSNDSSEERIFPAECQNDAPLIDDNYMLCLSEAGDSLSQWRGYCFGGGAAIKLNFSFTRPYSVLHADFEKSGKFELVWNAPLPVLYVPVPTRRGRAEEEEQNQQRTDTLKAVWGMLKQSDFSPGELVPYFKNDKFIDENELRLLFENSGNELSSCIRFRSLESGVKVPYMVVKMGDMGENFKRCEFDVGKYEHENTYIGDLMNDYAIRTNVVTIPQGSDQEAVYYRMEKVINKFNKDAVTPLRIECEGHLPVEEIVVSPTFDRERKAEQIRRYCWSKYWLRNTRITYSEIPYIPPAEMRG